MKKVKLLSIAMIVALVASFNPGTNANSINDTNIFDIASTEFVLDKNPQLSYVVYGFMSLDPDVPVEYRESSQYIENYSIEFLYPDQVAKQKNSAAKVIQSGTVDVMNTDKITIATSEISKIGTKEIEVPCITDDIKRKIISASKQGVHSILRSISVNVFYSNLHCGDARTTMFVSKSSVQAMENTTGNEVQNFHRMYAEIHVYDEYNGSQKRHSFNAYHFKYDPLNNLVEGMAYVSTYQKDSRPDVIALGWGLGGAIGLNDLSIDLEGAYNLQCETCDLNGRKSYAYNTFTQFSSGVSKHSSVFTGTSIGFNIPDIGAGQCEHCGANIPTRPAALSISATSGWFNKGGYNGKNGTARSEYVHTYTNRTLSLSPSISSSFEITFSANLVENQDYEKTWVYAPISPN